MTPRISLQAQIDEVARELTVRSSEYPARIRKGEMRSAVADLHIERMRAVSRTLQWLQAHETEVREFVAARRTLQDAQEEA